MKRILHSAFCIAFTVIINLGNVYSQVQLAKGVYPAGFNIQNTNAISEISKFVDHNYKKGLELAAKHNEIAYTLQYKEVYGRDTAEIIQIKLKPAHTMVWSESFYFIKNLRKSAMVYYSADTLFPILINGRINYIFVWNSKGTFYTDIYCFDKSYKNPETKFWVNTDVDYTDGKYTDKEYLILGSISVINKKSELFVEFKVKNERTNTTRSQRKKIKLD